MNLLLRSTSKLWHHRDRSLRASTNALASFSSSPSSLSQIDSLSDRILRAGDPSHSIVPVLDQCLEEGKRFKVRELRKCVKTLRENCRSEHALQVLEWYTNQKGYKVYIPDIAVRLQLIWKIHGLEKAEEYFKNIPETYRGYQVYDVLLYCYSHDKKLEKAEAMLQSMGFEKTAVYYHTLLTIYSRMRKFEKLDILMQEIEEKGIICDIITYNVRLRAYLACFDIEGMVKFLTKMEANPQIKMNFDSYIIAANGFLKAGLFDKTVMMLKRSEEFIRDNLNFGGTAYETLFSLYAAVGSKDDVYRLWNLRKQVGSVLNMGYIHMINALLILDDLDGAEKIWEEWYSGTNIFVIHIANMMIIAFSKRGSMEKAEAYMKKIEENGKEPNAISWDHLAAGYQLDGQMMKAVEAIKKAILKSKAGWRPKFNTLTSCLEYLNGQGDKEAAEALLRMINEQCSLSKDAYNRLSRV